MLLVHRHCLAAFEAFGQVQIDGMVDQQVLDGLWRGNDRAGWEPSGLMRWLDGGAGSAWCWGSSPVLGLLCYTLLLHI
jgi:hypothetical protein